MEQEEPPTPPTQEELRDALQSRILAYAEGVIQGTILANKWIYAACNRFQSDLEREDIYFDWDEALALVQHYERLSLIGEWSSDLFKLHDWQEFAVCNMICWKLKDDGRKRFKLCLLQVARGNGKTTLMAGLALYDLMHGMGKRVNVIANNEEQASILLDTAKTMIARLPEDGHDCIKRFKYIERTDSDCMMNALPALERSLDGLNPSMWVADEAAEFKGRFLTKLLTTGAKRKESTGVIITTPGSNPENIYMEIVKQCEAVLSGEIIDDTIFALLYGLDKDDELDNENLWGKANPGLRYGQPDLVSLKRSWNTMKQSPMGRSEFSRYHGSRFDENTGGWLDMSWWDDMVDSNVNEEYLAGRVCYGGLDLSKSGDMTAFVLAFPMEDGRVFFKGRYWFPKEGLAQRELDYRMPVRTWAKEGKLEISAGREIDYEQIRIAINEARQTYDLRVVCYDAWGSKYLAETLMQDGVPLQTYRMAIGTFAPGCQLWMNHWMGKRMAFADDPIMRRACAEATAKRDINGNIRPVKSREHCIIDPLVAGIMALHSFGGKQTSVYELEADAINGDNRWA
jgi:phage terminase large subunit-like protein